MKQIYLSFLILIISTTSQAAFVSYDEALLDNIYSQDIFRTIDPGGVDLSLDIRFNDVVELVSEDFLNIDSNAELGSLWSNHVGARNVVNAYFVDSLDIGGSGLVGIGEVGANDLAIESVFASNNPTLLAHELGHNLNMIHLDYDAVTGDVGPDDLMHPFILGGTNISFSTFIDMSVMYPYLGSVDVNSVIQGDDATGYFVEITPILVTSGAVSAVPEPASIFLMMIGAGGFSVATRRKA